MFKRPNSDAIIALAGVFQAVALVDQIARDGMADSQPMQASIASLFKIDAESATDVFGGLDKVSYGLRQLVGTLKGGDQRNMLVTQYGLLTVQLAGKLLQNAQMANQLQQGIKSLDQEFNEQGPMATPVLSGLSKVYKDTISHLRPQVMVRGSEGHLQREAVSEQVRALLMAAIRAGVLYQQSGATRFQLLWHRKHILQVAQEMLRAA